MNDARHNSLIWISLFKTLIEKKELMHKDDFHNIAKDADRAFAEYAKRFNEQPQSLTEALRQTADDYFRNTRPGD